MRPTTSSARRGIDRARRIWAELDYAQRRSMELRTGVPMGTSKHGDSSRRGFDELGRLRAA